MNQYNLNNQFSRLAISSKNYVAVVSLLPTSAPDGRSLQEKIKSSVCHYLGNIKPTQ